jgi:hypothetical protein
MSVSESDHDEAFMEEEEEECAYSEYDTNDQEMIDRAESDVNSVAPTDSSQVSAGESRPQAVDFPGFDKTIMWMERCTDPTPIKPNTTDDWMPLSHESTRIGGDESQSCRPHRAMVFNIPRVMFAAGSERLNQWEMKEGSSARFLATGALLSLLFAGTHKGIPSGAHEELVREDTDDGEDDKKKRRSPLAHVDRYTFIDPTQKKPALPMWQILVEYLYNSTRDQVSAVRIWMLVRFQRP